MNALEILFCSLLAVMLIGAAVALMQWGIVP